METNAKNKRKDDAGALGGMSSREMYLMQDKQWELQPADFSCIKNLKLRLHCQKFLNRPVQMKLSRRKGKYGLRAQGQLNGGKRLRGFWRESISRGGGEDFLKVSYDDAVKQRLTTVEFEVQLPPTDKKSKSLPSVIYSVAMEPGTMNPKSVVPRGAATVRVLPEGHREGEEVSTLNLGKAFVSLPMRSGIVDPGWAKGQRPSRAASVVGALSESIPFSARASPSIGLHSFAHRLVFFFFGGGDGSLYSSLYS